MTDHAYYQDHDCGSAAYSRGYGKRSEPAASYTIIPIHKPASDEALKETASLLKGIVIDTFALGTLSDRVFGGQLRQGRAAMMNSESLISERGRLLDRHVREIDERRNDTMNRLHALSRPYSVHRPQDAARVEKLLLDLDSARRDEYLTFWRDLARERKELLESAAEYQASRNRASLLRGTEEPDD